ncbi:glycoside hydrolase family 3 protein [Mixta tenebrionis]|uniref:beta-glucosidase n=1 Tax=Mixta tenebrionis TaxID=2562439 RepID=A0A506VAJ0_9GAMM|nr:MULTISPECIES: glycoside hydrolase family 3 N-terminal domain-containing protein [Mixta]QHM74493.1 Beta-glucosidase BoGH3B [Mixta theicola]TPW42469.1 glycoside hydrolase family 3 protein [Mixta tenebrionis]
MFSHFKLNKLSLAVLLCLPVTLSAGAQPLTQVELGYYSKALISDAGLKFKDLNRDDELNPYEDWRLPAAARAADLIKRMTLKEKAGVMMYGDLPELQDDSGNASAYDMKAVRKMVVDEKVNSLLTRLSGDDPSMLAEQNNMIQQIAEGTRLGIPATISIAPRHSWQPLSAAGRAPGKFSRWPEAPGIGAIGSEVLAKEYADRLRREYRATGITQVLSPQADIVSEPRWPGIRHSFGENPELVRKMVRGYIEGIQHGGDGLNSQSVAAVVKHWVGYGAAQEGWDGHNAYGKQVSLSAESLKRHIMPFKGAFESRAAAVMPAGTIMQGVEWDGKIPEPVGAGFSHFLLGDLLRDEYRFDGTIVSDWLITHDCDDRCVRGSAPGEAPQAGGMPWGVEALTKEQRIIEAVNAGVDQLGGVTDTALLVSAVKKGLISEERIDASVKRILQQKFEQGLFEQPYVDAALADELVGSAEAKKEADGAQFRSLVLLQNKNILPLKKGVRVWLYGIDKEAAVEAGLTVVKNLVSADVALMRISAPYEQLHPGYFFGSRQHEGSLAFNEDNQDYKVLKEVSMAVPVVLSIYLDRPAILANVRDKSSAIIANFGVSDEVLISRLLSDSAYTARLPFALPATAESVKSQKSDEPGDLKQPLFPLGYGLAR